MAERRIPYFFKVFLPNFSAKHLDIPPKFTQNIRGELPQKLQLVGPSSNMWNVELRMRGDRMSIVRGWKEFVNDHSLMLGDFMVFRYEDLNLYVQIFDQTACLKEEAFTAKPSNAKTKRVSPKEILAEKGNRVRKTHVSDDSECSLPNILQKRGRMIKQPKLEPSETPDIMVDTNDIPPEDAQVRGADGPPEEVQVKFDFISSENLQDKVADVLSESVHADYSSSDNLQDNVADIPSDNVQVKVDCISLENLQDKVADVPSENVQVKVGTKRARKKKARENDGSHNPNIRSNTEKSDSEYKPPAKVLKKISGKKGRAKKQPENVKPTEPVVQHENAATGESYTAPLKSQRRPVTKRELSRALERAEVYHSLNPLTVVIMRDSYVYHHFQLNLPFSFAKVHLPRANTKMTLWGPNGRSWTVAYLYYRRRAGIRSGWSRFSYDNNLETGDVCVFELIKPDEMRVHIFRVLDEIMPLVRFNPRSPK
ncbi:putative transcription factor B3-Domain family [Dioscorea sansibarensis]